jgi:hypothetical protein
MFDESNWTPEHFEMLMEIKADPNWGEKTGPFFHLQLPGEGPLGPFPGATLRDFSEEVSFPEGTKVKDAKSTSSWQELFSHPFFQRRKPQIVNNDNFSDSQDEVYLLVEGQKRGPYIAGEVHALIDTKEILLTDMVSFDEGHSWKKLYQYEEFDRRDLSQGNLPESPGWEIFKESNQEIENELLNPKEDQVETNAIAGLAFLENLKSGKTSSNYNKSAIEDIPEVPEEEEKLAETIPFPKKKKEKVEKTKNSTAPKVKYAYAFAIIFLLSGSIFFFSKEKSNHRNMASSPQSIKDAPTLEGQPIDGDESNNNKGRARSNSYRSAIVKKKKGPRSRRPASIIESRKFQDRKQLQDDPYEYDDKDPYEDMVKNDQVYDYDQGETPVQQDPVRAKVDKTTIDPEQTYYGDDEQETYDNNYDAQSEMLEDQELIQPTEVWGNEQSPAGIQNFNEEDADFYDEEAY